MCFTEYFSVLRIFFHFCGNQFEIMVTYNQATVIQDIGMRILVGSIVSLFSGRNLLPGNINETAYSCNMPSHNFKVTVLIVLKVCWATKKIESAQKAIKRTSISFLQRERTYILHVLYLFCEASLLEHSDLQHP